MHLHGAFAERAVGSKSARRRADARAVLVLFKASTAGIDSIDRIGLFNNHL